MNTYRRIRADPADWFAADEVKKAKDYQRPLTVARVVSLALNLVVVLVLIATHVAGRVERHFHSWPLQLIAVLGLFVVVFALVDVPISVWTTFVHERRWEFSTQTAGRFVADQLKGLALSLVLSLVLFLPLWWAIENTSLWWVVGWGVFFVFTVLIGFLYPIVIAPIFNKFTPLDDEMLSSRLRGLAEGVGMRIKSVEVMDASKRTRKDNAYFAGIGSTRQIVVFDNLLEQTPDVVASVVAHELGHWRRRHVGKSLALGTLVSLFVFGVLRLVSTWHWALHRAGVSSIKDPAAFPLVALAFVAAFSATSVLAAWVSRAHERQADLDALEITQDYHAFVATELGLSKKNLIDLAPSWWTYVRASHPAPAERLELAKLWRSTARTG